MATRATLRTRVRRELGDSHAVQLWHDDQINDHIGDAVRDFAYAVPRDPLAVTLATVAEQREYALGVEATEVVGVEFPLGTLLPRATSLVPAEATPDMPASQQANVWTANLQTGLVRLFVAPASGAGSLRVYYRPLLTLPGDDTTGLTLESDEEAIVVLLACRSLWDLRLIEEAKRGLRSLGGNPFAQRVDLMVGRRRRRARMGGAVAVG